MSRKKVFLLLISLVVMMSLFSNTVFGQQGGLGGIAETIRRLFGFLPEIVTLNKLVGNDTAALFWAKFLIWLLLFAVLYFGAGFVFKERNRISTVVALVIAIMGTLTIPNSVIIGIFQTYSLAAGFIVWFIPVAAGLYVVHKIENRMLKAVFYLLLMIILLDIDRTISSVIAASPGGVSGTYEFFSLLLLAVIIAFFWNLFAAFGGGQKVAEKIDESDTGKKIIGGDVGDWLRGHKRKEGEEEEIEDEEEKEEKEEIKATVAEINGIKGIHKDIGGLKKIVDTLISGLIRGTGNLPATIGIYDPEISPLKDDLDELIELDEKIEKYAEKVYKLLRSGRASRKKIRIAREIKRMYPIPKIIEKMIVDVKTELESTRGLPKITAAIGGVAYGVHYTGPFPTDNESATLQKCLDEIKKAYNLLVGLFNLEKKTLKEMK